MRFSDWLNEKTSKKEFEAALNNDNINAGVEFEFIFDEDVTNRLEDNDEFQKLVTDVHYEIQKIDTAMKGYFHANEELDNDISELHNKISDNKIRLSDLEDDDKIEALEDEIAELKDKIKELDEEERERIWEEYESDFPHMNNLPSLTSIMEMLEDNFGWYSELSDRQINQKLFEEYIEMQDYIIDLDSLWNTLYGVYFDGLISDLERMVDNIPGMEELMNNHNFPHDLYQGWEVEEDGSLTTGGVEIITPITPLPELIGIIEDVFDWIDEKGHTDKSCGFHVHMSINTPEPIDHLKLILFIEEGILFQSNSYFKNRINNSYAMDLKHGHINTLSPFTPEDLKLMAKKEKLDKHINTGKYMGVHLIDLVDNHVEFRYMGGSNYHKKFDKVRAVIANYAHWLSVAVDPEYKKKEYIKKANRLSNEYNANYLYSVINNFESMVKNYKKNISDKKTSKLIDRAAKETIKPFKQQYTKTTDKKESYLGIEVSKKLFQNMKDKIRRVLNK